MVVLLKTLISCAFTYLIVNETRCLMLICCVCSLMLHYCTSLVISTNVDMLTDMHTD